MINIRVEIPRFQQQRLLKTLSPRAVQFAETQALNRTAANVQKVGINRVARAMGIKRSQVRKRGKSVSARAGTKFGAVSRGRKATRARLFTSVIGAGKPFNVRRWDAKPVKVAGRTVATEHAAYGRRQIAKRTWQLPSGAVVVRSGNSFRSVFGPGIAQMMERRDVMQAMQTEATARFPGHFAQAFEFAFSSRAPRFVRG